MHLFTAFALLASTQRRRGPALARRGAAAAADDGRLPSEPLPPWLDGVDEELCRGTLTAREADVVVARFFRAGRPSQLDVSLALGLSLSRTSILERAARDKLAALLDERSDLEPATFDRFQAQGALLLGYFVAQVGFFYCKEDLGLDEATLARIVYLHGDVIAQRRDTIKAKGDAIKDALGLSTPVLAKLVAAQPTVLSLSVETLGRKLDFLRKAYVLSKADAAKVVCACPSLLSSSIEVLEANAGVVRRAVGAAGARQVAVRAPRLLRNANLQQNYEFIEAVAGPDVARRVLRLAPNALASSSLEDRVDDVRKFGGDESDAAVAKALRRGPSLLAAPTKRYIALKRCLRSELDDGAGGGKGAADARAKALLAAVVTKAPQLVNGVNVESLRLRLRFLRRELGVPAANLVRVVQLNPGVLALSVDGNLRPRLLWLAHRLLRNPAAASDAPEDLVEEVLFEEAPSEEAPSEEAPSDGTAEAPRRLLTEDLDAATLASLAGLVARYPAVLTLSVAGNLAPKLAALAEAAGSDREAAAAVVAFPPLLGYSLETRIRPRLDALKERELPFACIVGLITATDQHFPKRLQGIVRFHERAAGRRVALAPRPRRRRRRTDEAALSTSAEP